MDDPLANLTAAEAPEGWDPIANSTLSRGLCSSCTEIAIENITPPCSFQMHANLQQLSECGNSCLLCREACRCLADDKKYKASVWHGEPFEHLYATLTLGMSGKLGMIVQRSTHGYGFRDTPAAKSVHSDADIVAELDFQLSVLTYEDDPAAGPIPWMRRVRESTASVTTLALARHWVSDCLGGHRVTSLPTDRACGLGSNRSHTVAASIHRPTRLLEIGESGHSLGLVQAGQPDSPYVALSYVWGVGDAPWRTTRATVDSRQCGFSVRDLPQTLRDAIYVTRVLGYYFIWIDCLCIVQDDDTEWKSEASKMASIYQGALVTIVADCSSHSASGLFNSRSFPYLEEMQHACATNKLSEGRRSTLYFVHQHYQSDEPEINTSPPSRRGWCCQERAVSSRILHFGRSQIFWRCRDRMLAEDNISRARAIRGIGDILLPNVPATSIGTQHWQYIWYHDLIATDYSERALTHSKDKLNAVAGIAALIQAKWPTPYHAGHWEEGMVASLLWTIPETPNKDRKTSILRAPSWSWASQDTYVGFNVYVIGEFEPVAETLAVHTDVDASNPLGEVTGGFLKLRAPTLRGRLAPTQRYDPEAKYYQHCDVHVENSFVARARTDVERHTEDDVIVCVLGVTSGKTGLKLGYALLLSQHEGFCERVGHLSTTHEAVPREYLYSETHGFEDLETMLQAPMEELTIV